MRKNSSVASLRLPRPLCSGIAGRFRPESLADLSGIRSCPNARPLQSSLHHLAARIGPSNRRRDLRGKGRCSKSTGYSVPVSFSNPSVWHWKATHQPTGEYRERQEIVQITMGQNLESFVSSLDPYVREPSVRDRYRRFYSPGHGIGKNLWLKNLDRSSPSDRRLHRTTPWSIFDSGFFIALCNTRR
jgi:hypothetical protein